MEWNRRQFLVAGLAGPTLFAQQRQSAALIDKGFGRVTELAPGLYVTIADPSKGSQCVSNGGVIAGRDAVLIVEGHMEPPVRRSKSRRPGWCRRRPSAARWIRTSTSIILSAISPMPSSAFQFSRMRKRSR